MGVTAKEITRDRSIFKNFDITFCGHWDSHVTAKVCDAPAFINILLPVIVHCNRKHIIELVVSSLQHRRFAVGASQFGADAESRIPLFLIYNGYYYERLVATTETLRELIIRDNYVSLFPSAQSKDNQVGCASIEKSLQFVVRL